MVWQLVSALTVLLLLVYDTGELFYAAASYTEPSYAACTYVALLQLSWLLLALYFLFRGVWLENAFQVHRLSTLPLSTCSRLALASLHGWVATRRCRRSPHTRTRAHAHTHSPQYSLPTAETATSADGRGGAHDLVDGLCER